MSKLVFRLRHVPDDEAADVRELLEQHDIDYFETAAGNWGISMPALWVNKDEDFPRARELIDQYQEERGKRIRQEYELSRQRGEARTLWHSFIEKPIQFVLIVGVIIAVLYLSLYVFLSM